MNTFSHQDWLTYCNDELSAVTPLLEQHSYQLSDHQPHLQGERFLMQAVTTTSGRKLILFGTDSAGKKVVIKATRDAAGKKELIHERYCRSVLNEIKFAAEVFHTPAEIAWLESHGFIVAISEFIEQTSTFLDRPLPEQFEFALKAFKAQEGAHATTASHFRAIKKVYALRTATEYLKQFNTLTNDLLTGLPEDTNLQQTLTEATDLLTTHQIILDQYSGFLTHTDFVPHNIRINNQGVMYLLDHSSLTFGNKYEGWARFINFMELYNPPLASALVQYVKDNRSAEESLALKLMRTYRLGEITWYYFNKIAQSDGNLKQLNQARVTFWSTILSFVLTDRTIPPVVITDYQTKRDSLRSDAEKDRQRGLH